MEKFPIQPLNDRVIVRVFEVDTKTASGLILHGTEKSAKMRFAEVVAVGRGVISDGKVFPLEVKVGDFIQFQWTATVPEPIELDGDTYYMINERVINSIWDPSTKNTGRIKGVVLSEKKG